MADALSYADWNAQAGLTATNLSQGTSVDSLREENGAYRILDIDQAVALVGRWGRLPLHPLCGGCPPELAWPYLRRAVEEVMPGVSQAKG